MKIRTKSTRKKHGLSFETDKEVFYDENAVLFDDPDHSIGEERFLIIGIVKESKICIVSHCYKIFRRKPRGLPLG